jgi:type IV pilus assembly protein PilQ
VQPIAPISEDPTRVGVSNYEVFETDFTTGAITSYGEATFSQFPLFQYPRRFLSTLQAQILTRNAKILTDPTLVVQEGETANVNITEEVISNITSQTQTTGNTSNTTVTAVKDRAGLQLAGGNRSGGRQRFCLSAGEPDYQGSWRTSKPRHYRCWHQSDQTAY